MKPIIIAGIGTDVGKTLVSAVLVEALGADYWKPIQAGSLEATDTDRVRQLVTREDVTFHPEAYRLQAAISPHAAAAREHIEIEVDELLLPPTKRQLLIELCGGLMVPVSRQQQQLDAFIDWDPQIILVSRHYLGSINHTLLSIEALDSQGLSLMGIVFNGESDPETENVIVEQSGAHVIGHLRPEETLNPSIIRSYADQWKTSIPQLSLTS